MNVKDYRPCTESIAAPDILRKTFCDIFTLTISQQPAPGCEPGLPETGKNQRSWESITNYKGKTDSCQKATFKSMLILSAGQVKLSG
jgi:hypothetical protein